MCSDLKKLFANVYKGFGDFEASGGLDTRVLGCF
jgi:hypothetical protein